MQPRDRKLASAARPIDRPRTIRAAEVSPAPWTDPAVTLAAFRRRTARDIEE